MDTNYNNYNARKIAFTGILLAVNIITLLLATTLTVNELSLFALSSFYVSLVVIEYGINAGWLFYAASCILSLILPNKPAILPYVFFFGIYGILKYYAEKVKSIFLSYTIKLIFFNLYVFGAGAVVRALVPDFFNSFPWYLAVIVFEIIFLIYDYAYTLFIDYYKTKLKKVIRK